jgi:hypothetical protein
MADSQPSAGTSDIPFSSATLPPAETSLSRPLGWFWISLLLAAAVIWSLATANYRFGQGDDGWQAPMVLHRMNPSLLTKDPLVSEIGRYYQSGLFPLLALASGQVGIARSYAWCFVLNRVLTICAYYYFARACTGRRSTAVLAAWLLTGFGYYGFGTYLSGTPMLEEKLVPRTAALPFALAALAATVCGRPIEAGAWIIAVAFLHPVTGVNTLGIFLVYGLLSKVPLSRAVSHPDGGFRRFLAVDCILVLIGGVFAWTQLRTDAPLWLDNAWRAIIAGPVGPYVFIGQDTAWAPERFPTALVLGAIAILACRDQNLERIAVKFGVAALFACVLHWVAVDRLGFHPLLEASPERATFIVVAMAGVGLAAWLRSLAIQSAAGTALAYLMAAAIVLRLDYRWLLVIVLAALVLSLPMRFRAISAIGVATAAICIALLAWRGQGSGEGPAYRWPNVTGLTSLKALGITGDDVAQWEMEGWIREHSTTDDMLLPPFSRSILSRGWQINSERACLFNISLHTYTHFSPDLARRYVESVGDAQRLVAGTWEDLIAYARQRGACWIITDDDYKREHPDLPPADFARGPYEVRQLSASR